MKTLTPEQKQINKLTRELRSLYSQLSFARMARDQWRKRAAAKDEKAKISLNRSVAHLLTRFKTRGITIRQMRATITALRELARDKQREVDGLRKSGASELARYQEHLSQKVRALEANKVTIADMNLELADLRRSYDAKREHAIVLENMLSKRTKEVVERDTEISDLKGEVRRYKLGKRGAKSKAAIDTPKNWALLNQRDEQWISSLQQLVWSAQNLMEKGPTPPVAGIYREAPDPADGNVKLGRITRKPTPAEAEPLLPFALNPKSRASPGRQITKRAFLELKLEGIAYEQGDGTVSKRQREIAHRLGLRTGQVWDEPHGKARARVLDMNEYRKAQMVQKLAELNKRRKTARKAKRK